MRPLVLTCQADLPQQIVRGDMFIAGNSNNARTPGRVGMFIAGNSNNARAPFRGDMFARNGNIIELRGIYALGRNDAFERRLN
jgi:hypothetical protein